MLVEFRNIKLLHGVHFQGLSGCKAVVTNILPEGHEDFECTLYGGCGFIYLDQNKMIFGETGFEV